MASWSLTLKICAQKTMPQLVSVHSLVMKRRGRWNPRQMKQAPSTAESCKRITFGNWWCCEAWNYILWHLCSWPLFPCLLWGRQLFISVGTHCVVRCPPWLHVLWFGGFFTWTLMVVCQTMVLDGDKRAQLVQLWDRAKWNFSFLC
jgi:hypothetical protein